MSGPVAGTRLRLRPVGHRGFSPTAREANARDFRILFLEDGTATTGSEAAQMQKATLGVLDGLFAQVLTVDEMPQKSGIIGVLIVSTLISN